jgi:GlpG protein
MAEFVVIETSLDENLQDFSRYLWQQKMPHRIVNNNDKQLLLVGSENDAKQVALAFQKFQSGDLDLTTIEHKPSPNPLLSINELRRIPVTLIFLLFGVLGFFIVAYDNDYNLVRLLTFFDFERTDGKWTSFIPSGQYWRLITPIFLHFSIAHIAFNTLWLWDLGRRFEHVMGSGKTLGAILLIALGSNVAQYVFSGANLFGGMSGVIYGLLGYAWVWGFICPERSLQLPQGVINFMLIWLVVCMVGFTELMGLGSVANAAHVGGLVIGMLLGLGMGLIARRSNVE